jgi:hypothetical protein
MSESAKDVEVYVQLLKTVQKDLYELNLPREKAIEIWKIGVESFRGFVAGGTKIDNPAMFIPWWMSKGEGGKK